MAVDTVEIGTVFSSMMGNINTELNTLYTNKVIDAEIYAKVISSLTQSIMQLATQTVQQQPQVDATVEKLIADKLFTQTQEIELSSSVIFNNKIKALDSYADMIGTMGAGSLVISSDMWTTFFEMISGLNSDASTPSSTTISKEP